MTRGNRFMLVLVLITGSISVYSMHCMKEAMPPHVTEAQDTAKYGRGIATRDLSNGDQSKQRDTRDLSNGDQSKQLDSQGSSKSMHMVFSTGCTTNQNMQSELLIYSIRRVGFTGHVTRLLSDCDQALTGKFQYLNNRGRKSSVEEVEKTMAINENTHLYVTPQFDTSATHPFLNKGAGVSHWLQNTKIDADFVAVLDPDFIMLHTNFGEFTNPTAQLYEYGTGWYSKLDKLGKLPGFNDRSWNDGEIGAHFPVGPPYIVNPNTLREISALWVPYGVKYCDESPDILCEMYGYSAGAVHLNYPHTLKDEYMISNVGSGREGWKGIDNLKGKYTCGDLSVTEGLPPFIHYCQGLNYKSWNFHKGHIPFDMLECELPLFMLPPKDLPQEDMSKIEFRTYFSICHTLTYFNEFLKQYKAKHCVGKMYLEHEFVRLFGQHQQCSGQGYKAGCWNLARLVDADGKIIPVSDIGQSPR